MLARPETTVPLRTVKEDRRDRGERLDVVHHRRRALVSVGDGIGGALTRKGVSSLQRIQKGRLLATDVRARAAAHVNTDRAAGAEDVIPQDTGGLRLLDRRLEECLGLRILVAQVEERARGSRGDAGERDPFEHRVRIVIHERPILEAPWLPFVGVTHHRLGTASSVPYGAPLPARRKRRAAPPRELTGVDRLDHVFRRHRCHGRLEGGVSARAPVPVERLAPGFTNVREDTLADACGRGWRKRGGARFQPVRAEAYEGPPSPEDGNRLVTPTAARHRGGPIQFCEEVVRTPQVADGAGADPGCGDAVLRSSEVVVEGHGPVELRDGDPETARDGA